MKPSSILPLSIEHDRFHFSFGLLSHCAINTRGLGWRRPRATKSGCTEQHVTQMGPARGSSPRTTKNDTNEAPTKEIRDKNRRKADSWGTFLGPRTQLHLCLLFLEI